MPSNFTKRILIEQTELDGRQQRQFLEHLPELQAIVRSLINMRNITASNKLTE